MPTAKELREKRAQVVNSAREILKKSEAEARDLNAEEQGAWDKANAEIDTLGKQIERLDKLDAIDAQNRKVLDPDGIRNDNPGSAVGELPTDLEGLDKLSPQNCREIALQGWMLRNSVNQVSKAQYSKNRKAYRACAKKAGVSLNGKEFTVHMPGKGLPGYMDRRRAEIRRNLVWDAAEQRYVNSTHPLSTQQGGAGGFLVEPGQFLGSFETALLAYGYMMQVAEVMRTETAAPMPWPTANDTTNKGRRLNQNAPVDNTGANIGYPTFGATMFYAYKYTSDEILVPFELARDNAVGLVNWLGEALGIRIGRILNDDLTTGTAEASPNGIVTAATSGKTAASSTAIKFDEVIDLEYSVDPAYRFSGEGVGYMAHDAIVQYLRKLKDGDGRYLWQPSQQQGEPDRLNGYPFTRNQSMASSVATTNKTLLFGALRKYKVRQVGDLRMYRLVERYRDNDQDAFLAFQEFDGNLIDAGTHPVKYLVHP